MLNNTSGDKVEESDKANKIKTYCYKNAHEFYSEFAFYNDYENPKDFFEKVNGNYNDDDINLDDFNYICNKLDNEKFEEFTKNDDKIFNEIFGGTECGGTSVYIYVPKKIYDSCYLEYDCKKHILENADKNNEGYIFHYPVDIDDNEFYVDKFIINKHTFFCGFCSG